MEEKPQVKTWEGGLYGHIFSALIRNEELPLSCPPSLRGCRENDYTLFLHFSSFAAVLGVLGLCIRSTKLSLLGSTRTAPMTSDLCYSDVVSVPLNCSLSSCGPYNQRWLGWGRG